MPASLGQPHPPPNRLPPRAGYRERPRRRPARHKSRWHWLLAIPVTVPLLTPLYDRAEPQLWGIPFFYWAQLASIGLTMVVTALVYLLTRARD